MIIFFSLCTIPSGYVGAQVYSQFVKEVRKEVFAQSKSSSFPPINRKEDIVPVPQGYYVKRGADLMRTFKPGLPILDSFAVYAVIKKDSAIIGVAENNGTGKFGFMTRGEFESIGRKQSEEITIRMIEKAFAYYKVHSLYFVYFFPEQRSRHEILAFVSKNNTYYIDRQLNVYKKLKDWILKYYDAPVFEQQMDEQFIRWQLKKDLTLPIARQLISDDYSYYAITNPTDTAGIMERFVKEIRKEKNMPDSVSNEMQLAILRNLPTAPLYSRQKKRVIRFLDKDIAYIIADFMTAKEREEYDRHRALKRWLLQKAWEMTQVEKK